MSIKFDSWDLQTFGLFLFFAIIAICAFAFYVVGCNNMETSIKILKAEGYNDIIINGSNILQCGKGDYSSDTFKATTVNGSKVKGVVCCGMLKSCTVRITEVLEEKKIQ